MKTDEDSKGGRRDKGTRNRRQRYLRDEAQRATSRFPRTTVRWWSLSPRCFLDTAPPPNVLGPHLCPLWLCPRRTEGDSSTLLQQEVAFPTAAWVRRRVEAAVCIGPGKPMSWKR